MTITLPITGQVDQNSPDIQRIALQYNVAIHLKPVSWSQLVGGGAGAIGCGGGGAGIGCKLCISDCF